MALQSFSSNRSSCYLLQRPFEAVELSLLPDLCFEHLNQPFTMLAALDVTPRPKHTPQHAFPSANHKIKCPSASPLWSRTSPHSRLLRSNNLLRLHHDDQPSPLPKYELGRPNSASNTFMQIVGEMRSPGGGRKSRFSTTSSSRMLMSSVRFIVSFTFTPCLPRDTSLSCMWKQCDSTESSVISYPSLPCDGSRDISRVESIKCTSRPGH